MTDQPVEPTPAEAAAAKLAELGETYKQSQAPRDDKIALAMAGQFEDGIFQSREHIDNIETAKALRASGIDDPVIIRETLSKRPISQAEHDEARSRLNRLTKDLEFQKRYLAGGGEERREMDLVMQVITRDVKKGTAA